MIVVAAPVEIDVAESEIVVNEANKEVLEPVYPNDFIASQREGSSFHDWCVQCEDRYDVREVEDRGRIGPLTYCGNCYPAQKDYGDPSKNPPFGVLNKTINLFAHFW